MHFRVQMKVRLTQPLAAEGLEAVRGAKGGPLVGYFLTMKVNANDVADAVALAQTIALAPPDKEGKERSFEGVVEEASIEAIEPSDPPEHTRPLLAPPDQRGVYYNTGLRFFTDDPKDGNKWWQFWRK